MADKTMRQAATDVAETLGIAADVPMTAEQTERFKAEFERAITEGAPLLPWLPPAPDLKPEQFVLQVDWQEEGEPRQDLYGPWDINRDTEAHLAQVTAFLTSWRETTGLDPDLVTMTIVQDPDAWLRARQEGRG